MVKEKIVIYLHTNDLTSPSWAVIDVLNDLSPAKQTVYRGDPLQLAALTMNKEVLVLVPAEDVLLTAVTLPKMSRARLLQALPYALEEQLIAEVETLHFAVGQQAADGYLPVAVVGNEKMQQWLSLLKSWQVVANEWLPISLALPLEEDKWHIAINEMAVVRLGPAMGFATDLLNLSQSLNFALVSSVPAPKIIHIDNSTHQTIPLLLSTSISIEEEHLSAEQLISQMACDAVKSVPINLLQGSYAPKTSRFPQMGKMWRAISYLAIAWVIILFLYPTISYFILKQRITSIDEQIAHIYKRQFPEASSIVAPKLRMQEKLQKITAQVGENRLLLLLGYLGKSMINTPEVSLKRFDYQNNQLTLELTAPSSDHFTAFTDFLSQQGLSVKQESANLTGERVNATLLIE